MKVKLKNFYRTPVKIKLLNLYNSKPSKDRFKRYLPLKKLLVEKVEEQ